MADSLTRPTRGPIYQTLTTSWPDPSNVVQVVASDGTEILKITLRFLTGGHVRSWDYVEECVRAVVNESGGQIVDTAGVRLAGVALPGRYEFKTESGTVTFAVGPAAKSRYRVHTGTSEGTMSNSKRSSSIQFNFKVDLIARDFNCLLTNTPKGQCTGAHIVPASRPDVYELLGVDYMFHVSCGLLLADGYHHSFDKYLWGLFPNSDGDLIVHYFSPTGAADRALHGHVIRRDRFRLEEITELPNVDLLRWHYWQCVMQNMRGFGVAPPLP